MSSRGFDRRIAPAIGLVLLAVGPWAEGPRSAWAGGLARPNIGGARALGWAGAFTAVADDPAALHYNPAGMATQYRDSVMLGLEFIVAPRVYTPITIDPSTGAEVVRPDQAAKNTPNFLPTAGFVTRLGQNGVPSRLALGVGFWNTFGGAVEYEKGEPTVTALNATQTAALELVSGIAYEASDFVQVGASVRFGLGLFSVDATAKPVDGEFSAFGFGAGFTLGVMVKPTEALRLGLSYRSALTIDTRGSGTLVINRVPTDVTPRHTQEWPQQASLGLLWRPSRRFGISAQVDWSDWSRADELVIEFEQDPSATQIFDIDFHDSVAAHLGLEAQVSDGLVLRGGLTFDGNAVPDRTIERQYLDADKLAVGLGATIALSPRWRFDTALEVVAGPARRVPDNTKAYMDAGFPKRANVAPGDHSGQVFTVELGVGFTY
jgi:long-chain fatty acid transport protein